MRPLGAESPGLSREMRKIMWCGHELFHKDQHMTSEEEEEPRALLHHSEEPLEDLTSDEPAATKNIQFQDVTSSAGVPRRYWPISTRPRLASALTTACSPAAVNLTISPISPRHGGRSTRHCTSSLSRSETISQLLFLFIPADGLQRPKIFILKQRLLYIYMQILGDLRSLYLQNMMFSDVLV